MCFSEEPEEELESSAKKVVDIVDAFRLQETQWDKKGFMARSSAPRSALSPPF